MGFLKGIFGSSKNEVWKQLAEELGGEFIEGGFFKTDKVNANMRAWTITLDTYTVSHGKTSSTYTRIIAPFVNNKDFKFKVYKKGFFSDVGKMLGMQDIEIGIEDFDENYIIKGNNEGLIKELLCKEDVRLLITQQPKISIEIKDKLGFFDKTPEEADILYFEEAGVLKDLERLKKIFLLFASILNNLYSLGVTSEENPNIK
ncbi:DUF3137 domain-containing protein [Alkaliphilus pronyensis]|uniref:DUF3137 domain-containing protein n=1 Tax=Alkaliphilus pronyensis TaxID=1482732 RepID=A0A6I0EXD4_9FIRM|nr:DUF3137 domain-containing protein [Alkaliphilus pronyensis]KAB3531645.1 DUF3137 domain-containing protein [Alkaliphilus pronyensis]